MANGISLRIDELTAQVQKLIVQHTRLPSASEVSRVEGAHVDEAEIEFYNWLDSMAQALAANVEAIRSTVADHADALKAAAERLSGTDELSSIAAKALENAINEVVAEGSRSGADTVTDGTNTAGQNRILSTKGK